MKITTQSVKDIVKFDPVELKIIIEDKDDLRVIYGLFNASEETIRQNAHAVGIINKQFSILALWNPINNLAISRGIKN